LGAKFNGRVRNHKLGGSICTATLVPSRGLLVSAKCLDGTFPGLNPASGYNFLLNQLRFDTIIPPLTLIDAVKMNPELSAAVKKILGGE
jgi:hypothetical protein